MCSRCVESGSSVGRIRDLESDDSYCPVCQGAILLWRALFYDSESDFFHLYKLDCGMEHVLTEVLKRELVYCIIYAHAGADS